MQISPWHPSDEATAASNLAAFIALRHAAGHARPSCPADLAAWRSADPADFSQAIMEFAQIDATASYPAAIAAAAGTPLAILLLARSGRQEITRADLRAGRIPATIHPMLAAGRPELLPAHAADHLLLLDLRPDQRALWPWPANAARPDPWPLGALLAGATLVLCEEPPADPAALAAAESARLLRRPG